ncbi:MAG: hypothetical protein IPI61_03540 [Syntrophaceae bacterium]|nr:hypothetical protein [Syntrophaceae bacterium]
MCGIVGFLSLEGKSPISDSFLESARDTMAHRGPDDAGLQVFSVGSSRIGLGHRRLSILDLSPLGHQPMSTDDGRLLIVFNGEIFNYRELRRILEDEEVIVSAPPATPKSFFTPYVTGAWNQV